MEENRKDNDQRMDNEWNSDGSRKQNVKPELPMNWFKFIIYFQLFANAVTNVWNGYKYITGMVYGSKEVSSMVYYVFPSMKFLDIAMGVGMFVMGFWAINIRQKLAYYRADGVKFYLNYILIQLIVQIVYIVFACLIAGSGVMDLPSVITSAVVVAALYSCNKAYFSKRMHLFTND